MNDGKLKQIVWFAGFEGKKSAVINRLITLKSWQHIYNSGVRMGNHAREWRILL